MKMLLCGYVSYDEQKVSYSVIVNFKPEKRYVGTRPEDMSVLSTFTH